MTGGYTRDKRSPEPKNEWVSKSMRSNRGKDTSPEIILRKALRCNGMSGYRLHWHIPGRPDICYPGKHIAIFVNGCFWHRCPHCELPLPENNSEFWKEKFDKNIVRDKTKRDTLIRDGWTVITIWECEIKKDLDDVISMIKEYM